MRTSRITDDMFARIPALLHDGMTKSEIAAMYGVTPGSLAVLCSQRGISLRKGGVLPNRTKLTLLRPTAATQRRRVAVAACGRAGDGQGQHGTAGQRSLGEDRQRRSLQGSVGRRGCMMVSLRIWQTSRSLP